MYKKQWQQEQYLNKGSYAQVFRVRMQGKDYALKKIYPKYLKNQNDRQIVQRQIMIMSKMDHPRIIKMHKAFVQEQEISLLLQFASGGSLHDQLRMYKKLPEHQVKRYVKDIVSALEYLHSRESPILHRDIKPENLLIDSEGNCKLADFGSANILDGQRRSYVGTRQYMAPQMQDEKPHGIEIDIWTLGVLIYQLLTGQVPSSRYYFPSHLSRPAEDVIKKLMNKDQSKRMSLQELKEHIWLYEQFNITPTIGENTAKSKIQIMRQKIKERINNREMKTQFFNLPLPKQKSVLQENQDINRQVKRYISLLMERDELKYKVLQNQKKIEQQQSRRMAQRPFLLQEIDRLKKQIKQYQSNIQILRNKPLKMEAQCRQIIQTLKKKIDELKEYIKSLPQRTKSQLLHFSSYEAHDEALPISDYIFTLRLQIMTSRRDALIELRAAKKIYLDIMEMTQVQDSLNTFEEKYEQSFEPTLTSLKQKML